MLPIAGTIQYAKSRQEWQLTIQYLLQNKGWVINNENAFLL
jgi:hypothetical protein